MAGTKLIQVIQETARKVFQDSKPTDLLFGVVTSVSPLKIKVDNRFELGHEFLIISKLCKELLVEVNHSDGKETIKIWDGLKVGDTVRLIRVHSGQLYYVLEREG